MKGDSNLTLKLKHVLETKIQYFFSVDSNTAQNWLLGSLFFLLSERVDAIAEASNQEGTERLGRFGCLVFRAVAVSPPVPLGIA